jgi:hypothetical protein
VYAEEPVAPAGLPSRRPLLFGLAFAAAALVAGAIAFGVSAMSGGPAPASPGEATPSAAAAPPPPETTATAAPSAGPGSAASSASHAASSSAFVNAAPPAPLAHPPPVANAPVFAHPMTAPPSPPSPPTVDCHPPFYFDNAGNKVFKKECL